MNSSYPNLNQLLGYLHQDFDLDYPSADHAIRDYLNYATFDEIVAAQTELEAVIHKTEHQPGRAEVLQGFSCDYYPLGDGWQCDLDWLRHVHEMLVTYVDEQNMGTEFQSPSE